MAFGDQCVSETQCNADVARHFLPRGQTSNSFARIFPLLMIEMNDTQITSMVFYLDVEILFRRFGLPMTRVT